MDILTAIQLSWIVFASIFVGSIASTSTNSEHVTVTFKTGRNTQRNITDRCINIKSSDTPSQLQLSTVAGKESTQQKYHFWGYRSYNCADDNLAGELSHQAGNFHLHLVLNMRSPICSFQLGRSFWPGFTTKVRFSYKGKRGRNYEVVNRGVGRCYDLCNAGQRYKYPLKVQILQKNEQVENNFVKLFSAKNCEDGSLLRDHSGSYKIQSGTDLVNLTAIYTAETIVKSFRIKQVESVPSE